MQRLNDHNKSRLKKGTAIAAVAVAFVAGWEGLWLVAKRDIVGGLDLTRVIAQADAAVKQAYERMRQPARFELYDLVNDPYEFHDLSDSPEHTDILRELQGELYAWREQTNDPLLDPGNLEQLSAEVRSVTKKNAGKTFPWKYPKYLPSPLLP